MEKKKQRTTLPFPDCTVILEYRGFDETVDVDELTKIDYSNLYAEAINT